MKKIWLHLAIALLSLNVEPAFGCSCPPSPPPLVALKAASAVFAGRVLTKTVTRDGVEVTFKVSTSWKGVTEENVIVFSDPLCGYDFVVGERYLVYAYASDTSTLTASLCSRTAKYDKAGRDRMVLSPLSTSGRWAMFILGVGIASTIVMLRLAKRHAHKQV